MGNDPVRFGILSFAHYHANFWAQSLREMTEAVLVGVWDEDPQRGLEAAGRYGTRYYRDWKTLFRECDAVGITSETVKHADLVEEATKAGMHILCEKPMATTLEDCNRIVRAVRKAGVVYMQNFPKRYDPVNHELVTMVHRGELGKIVMARIRHGHSHGLDSTFAKQWFVDPALSGGGTLIDEGIHAADFLLWLLGEPQEVRATISDRVLRLPVEDTSLAVFSYPSGTLAEVCTSWSFVASEQSVEVYGTKGSALLAGVDLASRDFSTTPYLKVFHRTGELGKWKGSETIPYFKQGNFHQQGPKRFIEWLRTGAEPITGAEEARLSVAMILTAYRAAATGQAQRIR